MHKYLTRARGFDVGEKQVEKKILRYRGLDKKGECFNFQNLRRF